MLISILCNICIHLCHYRVDTLLSIKIADFGLAKDVYSTEYYKHTRLLVKWMSIESLLDGYFDEKTDMVCTYVTTWIMRKLEILCLLE